MVGHKSTLVVPKYFPSNVGNFQIKNLVTSNCVKTWDKVAASQQGWSMEAPAGLGQGMLNLLGKVKFGKVYLSSNITRTAIMFKYFNRDR